MGEYFWIIAGILVYFIHNLYILKFSLNLLKEAKKNKVLEIALPIFNTVVFYVAYMLGTPYFLLSVIIYISYLVELACLSKGGFRQAWFGAASYTLSIQAVHLIILIGMSLITNNRLIAVYENPQLFYQTILICFVMLYILIVGINKYVPTKQLLMASNSKMYSEIISGTGTALLLLTGLDAYLIMGNKAYIEFMVTVGITCVFVLMIYYCVFFFTLYLVKLHPYKRKSDEATLAHGKAMQKKVVAEKRLYTDDLTKLYNRRFIIQKIDALCEDGKVGFGLMYADIFALKQVNDTLGHKVGDKYIIDVADGLRSSIREEDFAARLGGDEFLIILIEVTPEDMEKVAERIRISMQKKNEKESYTSHVNLGYRVFPTPQNNEEKYSRTEILEKVDELMKQEKVSYYEKRGN